MTGKLMTYENNCMSLSCRGTINITDGIINNISFKGYPRTYGDYWVRYYKNFKKRDKITQDIINEILSYNGKSNVVSEFHDK